MLVLDALFFERKHFSHSSLKESVSIVKDLVNNKGVTIQVLTFVGLACSLTYTQGNDYLQSELKDEIKNGKITTAELGIDGKKFDF